MRRSAAILASGVLALGAPVPAHAADYRGGCRLFGVSPRPYSLWTAVAYSDVVATDSSPQRLPTAAPVLVNCFLRINGGWMTYVLTASGRGAAVGAQALNFYAASGSTIEVCDDVTVDGEHKPLTCHTIPVMQAVPKPVTDFVDDVLGATAGLVCAVAPSLCFAVTTTDMVHVLVDSKNP